MSRPALSPKNQPVSKLTAYEFLTRVNNMPSPPSQDTPATWLDPAGICLSLLCAVHCLFMPIFITTLPLVGLGFLANEQTEGFFVIVALTVAVGSISWGFHLHRQQRALLTLGAAAAMMLVGRFALRMAPMKSLWLQLALDCSSSVMRLTFASVAPVSCAMKRIWW